MATKEQLTAELQDAMRSGDTRRRDVLRGVLTAITNTEIARVNIKKEDASREELTEPDILDVIQKQAKQRRESIEEYRKAGRTDLVQAEQGELEILNAYLPQQLSREEIAQHVRAIITDTGASGPGDKSKVMPLAIARMKGRADGRTINEVVVALLSGA